jgi:hypothetical protein
MTRDLRSSRSPLQGKSLSFLIAEAPRGDCEAAEGEGFSSGFPPPSALDIAFQSQNPSQVGIIGDRGSTVVSRNAAAMEAATQDSHKC